MDERWLHAMRNELNVLAVGILMLRTELEGSDRSDLMDALERMERAAGRCSDLLAAPFGAAPPAVD